MPKQPCVYILTNKNHTVLYTGVTGDLMKRLQEHREKLVKGFTARYNCDLLVYYEVFADMEAAITREKQIKAGSRKKKLALIEQTNGEWRDLRDSL